MGNTGGTTSLRDGHDWRYVSWPAQSILLGIAKTNVFASRHPCSIMEQVEFSSILTTSCDQLIFLTQSPSAQVFGCFSFDFHLLDGWPLFQTTYSDIFIRWRRLALLPPTSLACAKGYVTPPWYYSAYHAEPDRQHPLRLFEVRTFLRGLFVSIQLVIWRCRGYTKQILKVRVCQLTGQ